MFQGDSRGNKGVKLAMLMKCKFDVKQKGFISKFTIRSSNYYLIRSMMAFCSACRGGRFRRPPTTQPRHHLIIVFEGVRAKFCCLRSLNVQIEMMAGRQTERQNEGWLNYNPLILSHLLRAGEESLLQYYQSPPPTSKRYTKCKPLPSNHHYHQPSGRPGPRRVIKFNSESVMISYQE